MFENIPTVSSLERQQVLAALERLQSKLVQREEWTHSDNMRNLRDTLQNPLFNHILTLHHSIKQLRHELNSSPVGSHGDFNFSQKGQLIFHSVTPLSATILTNNSVPNTHLTAPSSFDLQKWVRTKAKGCTTELMCLSRPPTGGLGFSVVGLNPGGSSTHGVFVKHIQPGGVAHSVGLQEGDQILVINGRALEPGVSQQEALSLLQRGEAVELVISRERPVSLTAAPERDQNTSLSEKTVKAAQHAPHIDTGIWGHVEQIELDNDGSGLGFGIVGGKSGIVVRTLLPNSVAHRDGRLRTGDHILSIGGMSTVDLGSEQVVRALQACGNHVSMTIARDYQGQKPSSDPAPPPPPSSAPVSALSPPPPWSHPQRHVSKTPNLEGYEIHELALTKKQGQSLGISIIGYNPLTSQDAVGVFVKSIVPGSAADQNGNIRVHDRIIALNGVSLHGRTNPEVLEVMKQTEETVVLTVVRKKRGLERSLDKVERAESRVSLMRSKELRGRSAGYRQQEQRRARATEAELRAKWEQALGPNYQVLVVNLDPVIEDDEELQRSSKLLPIHTVRLGVELDSFDGHHYISSVVPEGPVGKHGKLRPEDELLEVNNVQVYGKSRREVIVFLKEVPPPFTLVCCRHPAQDEEAGLHWDSDSEAEPDPKNKPTMSEPGPWSREEPCQEEDLHYPEPVVESLPASEGDDAAKDGAEKVSDEEGELAMWSPEIQTIHLTKDQEKGLGFSILDYQDPLDPGRCVMVVRTLVAGGAAERSGRVLPGDQVVCVNSTQLSDLSLSEAVEVLKAAPMEDVRLGLRKPVVEGGEYRGRVHLATEISIKDIQMKFLHLDQEQEEGNEPELILDGGLPCNTSMTSVKSDVSPEEGQEMAVDEEVMQCRTREDVEVEDKEEPRKQRGPPPSWDEWRSSLGVCSDQTIEVKQEVTERQNNSTVTSEPQTATSVAKTTSGPNWRDGEANSELTHIHTESVRVVNTEQRRRRGQAWTYSTIGGQVNSDLPEREEGEGEETPAFSHWGPPRRVEMYVDQGQSLGLSIVGGHHVIKRLRNGEDLKGIFIKQVLPLSPAANTESLKTGDKILEVNGVDLRTASHEEAVNAIKSALSPVVFLVQSLSNTPRPVSVLAPSYSKHRSKRNETPNPAIALPPLRDPPPYRPPCQSETSSDLDQAKGPL